MGFAVLGLAWLVAMAERTIGKKEKARPIGRRLFALGLACFLATLATPFYYRLYVVIWEYATQTGALKLVMELQPPLRIEWSNWPPWPPVQTEWYDWPSNWPPWPPVRTEWYNWPLIVLLIAAAVTTIVRGLRLWDLVFLASAAFFSLRMQSRSLVRRSGGERRLPARKRRPSRVGKQCTKRLVYRRFLALGDSSRSRGMGTRPLARQDDSFSPRRDVSGAGGAICPRSQAAGPAV